MPCSKGLRVLRRMITKLLAQHMDSYPSEIIGGDLAEHLLNKTLTFLTDEKAINDRIFAAEQRGPIDAFHQWVDAHFVTDQLLDIFQHFKTSPQRFIEFTGFNIVLASYMGREYNKSDFVLQMNAMVSKERRPPGFTEANDSTGRYRVHNEYSISSLTIVDIY